ncbi:LysR family transcriptional regulator [Aureimonas flava]|uniref:LysR family transcriptional regulator n=1 Tax=Aureimonas flava TaxID=2320271 RepID=A0A3A1WI28_9HYPH|nr:LysR family transcriptional regulator [Aureimonas flava]RIY00243.1 LysR family transcriptional regulator [Aureimonas flava]
MDRRRLPLNALRAFEAVAHHGSFTAAATALNISQSALSRHVIGLEELIGHKLFERRRNALTLTESGETLLGGVMKAFERLEQTLDVVCAPNGTTRSRRLRVHLPPSFAMKLAVPLLNDFRQSFPDVVLEISTPYGGPATDVEVAVVYSRPVVDDAVTDLLWEERPTILCHPAVGAQAAERPLAAFVAENEVVHVRIVDHGAHHSWLEFARQNGFAPSTVQRGLSFDSASLAVEYVLSGQGLVVADPVLFAGEIASGALAAPVAASHYEGFGYYLKIDAEGLADPLISAFRSWLIQRFKTAEPKGRGAREAPSLALVRNAG